MTANSLVADALAKAFGPRQEALPPPPPSPEAIKLMMFKHEMKYEPESFLNAPKTSAELLNDAEQGFESVIRSMSRASSDEHFQVVTCFVKAFEKGIDCLLASRHPDDMALPIFLPRLLEKISASIGILCEAPEAARMIENVKRSKSGRAARWRGTGKGARGLDVNAPRNRLVFRLLDEMNTVRFSWNEEGVSAEQREALKPTLHERIREIIALPPLSPKTASAYHKTGVKMLKDAAKVRGSFTLHPAFLKGGEFERFDSANYSKSPIGALSEAWKSVAKWLESDRIPPKCQKDSRKG